MRKLKNITFSLLGLLLYVLVTATIVEKVCGTQLVFQYVYDSIYFIGLWSVFSLCAVVYIIKKKLCKRPVIFLLHISFLIILSGALVTHFYGIEGNIHLREGMSSKSFFDDEGTIHRLPFTIRLDNFKVNYYSGTSSPSDYKSIVAILDDDVTMISEIAMNNILSFRGYRFYQAGFDGDECGTTLLVSHDPIGIFITYMGYATLLLSMILFFLTPGTRFRKLLKSSLLKRASVMILILLSFSISSYAKDQTKVLPRAVAEKFGKISVLYNNRIAPLQTLMDDLILKLYGSSSYKNYTSEQVFAGLFFFPETWSNEPIVKINNNALRSQLNINGKYASINDFVDDKGNNKIDMLKYDYSTIDKNLLHSINASQEKYSLACMVISGELMQMLPYKYNGIIEWAFLDDLQMHTDHSSDITNWLKDIKQSVDDMRFDDTEKLIDKMNSYQHKIAGGNMPSSIKLNSEIVYDKLRNHNPIAMILISIGILSFIYCCIKLIKRKNISRWVEIILNILLFFVLIYISSLIALRWYIGSHIPLSNGFETMQFASWCSVVLTLILQRKYEMALPFGYILCGLSLLVSTFGETNPQITHLVPVLSSPLLSIHVVVIMIAYSLLAFMMLNGIMAIIMKFSTKDSKMQIDRLYILSYLMLYPALFLLTAGIFIGAVWANVSWGRYWGWDPKEVWALITMLVYSLAIHTNSLPLFKKKIFFHLFTIIAFLSVIITYFGVNFILGGMHSYA